jgi:hypothetical protein
MILSFYLADEFNGGLLYFFLQKHYAQLYFKKILKTGTIYTFYNEKHTNNYEISACLYLVWP